MDSESQIILSSSELSTFRYVSTLEVPLGGSNTSDIFISKSEHSEWSKSQPIQAPRLDEDEMLQYSCISNSDKELNEFFQDAKLVEKCLGKIDLEIKEKINDSQYIDAEIEKVGKKAKDHERKLEKVAGKVEALDLSINEYDKISIFFQDMLVSFEANTRADKELAQKFEKLHSQIEFLSVHKPSPSVHSSRLILSPRLSK